jgi:GntR family transcriptional regulator
MAEPATIEVDPASPVPPYEQIRGQFTNLIESGLLAAGLRLPPVRQLASDLSLAAGTVARAYALLEAAGLVITRRGGGTVVAQVKPPSAAQIEARLDEQAIVYARAARSLGADPGQALSAVRRAFEGFG